LIAAPIYPVSERDLRPIVAQPGWEKQRALWKQLVDVLLRRSAQRTGIPCFPDP
jgi:hypothetical protein